jgi:hypothetical protein
MCRNRRRKRTRPKGNVMAAKLLRDEIRWNPRPTLPTPQSFPTIHQWLQPSSQQVLSKVRYPCFGSLRNRLRALHEGYAVPMLVLSRSFFLARTTGTILFSATAGRWVHKRGSKLRGDSPSLLGIRCGLKLEHNFTLENM